MKRNSMSIRKKIMIWFSLSLLLIVGITLTLTFSISQSVFNTDIKTQLAAQVDANAQEIEFLNSLAGQEAELGDQYLSFGDGFLEIDDDFLKLVKEVRAHRIAMGSEIAPAAPLDVDILELVRKVCDEDFYKEDYRETTLKLISDSLEYEMLKKHYRELVEKVFE